MIKKIAKWFHRRKRKKVSDKLEKELALYVRELEDRLPRDSPVYQSHMKALKLLCEDARLVIPSKKRSTPKLPRRKPDVV